jgi:hypothetical protein
MSGRALQKIYPRDRMEPEKPKVPDTLEKELKRLKRQLDSENEALSKILKITVNKKQINKPKTS